MTRGPACSSACVSGAELAGRDEGNANGIALGNRDKLTVRVRGKDGLTTYQLSL